MSIAALSRAIEGVPRDMKDSIIGYALSVEAVLPDIFRKSGMGYREDIANQVVFLVGIKKFFSIVDSTFWMLNNSTKIMNRDDVQSVKVGGRDLSRNSEHYLTLLDLRSELVNVLIEHNIYEFMDARSPADIIDMLINERPVR